MGDVGALSTEQVMVVHSKPAAYIYEQVNHKIINRYYVNKFQLRLKFRELQHKGYYTVNNNTVHR